MCGIEVSYMLLRLVNKKILKVMLNLIILTIITLERSDVFNIFLPMKLIRYLKDNYNFTH